MGIFPQSSLSFKPWTKTEHSSNCGSLLASLTPDCKQLNDQNHLLKRNIFWPDLQSQKALSCHCKSFKLSTRWSFDGCKNYFYFAPSCSQNYVFSSSSSHTNPFLLFKFRKKNPNLPFVANKKLKSIFFLRIVSRVCKNDWN